LTASGAGNYGLASLQIDCGQDDLALENLRQAVYYRADDAEAWYWISVLRLRRGEYVQAEAAIREGLAWRRDAPFLTQWALTLVKLGRRAAAQAAIREAQLHETPAVTRPPRSQAGEL